MHLVLYFGFFLSSWFFSFLSFAMEDVVKQRDHFVDFSITEEKLILTERMPTYVTRQADVTRDR